MLETTCVLLHAMGTTHLHDYRATRIPINIPLCVFLGVGTARGAKEPRSAVYALHPSVFPQALCHHVRGSPSESPLPGSKQAQRQEPCAGIDAPCGRPAAPQVRKRQPWKKKEKEKSGEEAQGGERTESLNIKSGAPRHTSRH